MEDCGHSDVKTYIQSGNAVFQSDSVSESDIADLVEKRKGFRPQILILAESEFRQALENNPFSNAEGKTCHFYFCVKRPEAVDEGRLNQLKSDTEEFNLSGKVFYLHAPKGIGRSKLAANVERCLGVSGTARNLNTMNSIAELMRHR